MTHPPDCWCAYCEPDTHPSWDEELHRRDRNVGDIRTANPSARSTKVIATVTTPGKRKTDEKEMELVGWHVGGKRYVVIKDENGRLIQIEITDAVEEQLRYALRKTRP